MFEAEQIVNNRHYNPINKKYYSACINYRTVQTNNNGSSILYIEQTSSTITSLVIWFDFCSYTGH